MREEIKRQVELALSRMRSTGSVPQAGISPSSAHLKSSCASTEVPPQPSDDATLRFPVDDITEVNTPCELHIPEGATTIMVATGVVSPIDPLQTPICHGSKVPAGYARVSVDRVEKAHRGVNLDIEGGDGETTLGQAEKSFICWRKRYIIIPGASPLIVPSPPPPPPPRCE